MSLLSLRTESGRESESEGESESVSAVLGEAKRGFYFSV